MTYSIVARDEETGDLGVAVQSHFFGVGRIVAWAEAGVGAVATQSFADVSYGPRGLRLMGSGVTAPEALERLLAEDDDRALRQVGMVDVYGRSSAHTGGRCVAQAGHVVRKGVASQANMMLRDTCWDAMLEAFQSSTGALADRLLSALEAAEAEGGDIRGQQSAALLVVSGRAGDRPWDEVIVDVRVEGHERPLAELRRLVDCNRAYGLIGRALFTPGSLSGSPMSGDALAAAAADLALARVIVGANPEPSVWRGVLLARAGHVDEARDDFARAVAENPNLLEFLRRLSAVGLLPQDPELMAAVLPEPGHTLSSSPNKEKQ